MVLGPNPCFFVDFWAKLVKKTMALGPELWLFRGLLGKTGLQGLGLWGLGLWGLGLQGLGLWGLGL